MNVDLERTLKDGGEDLRVVVERLRTAPQARMPADFADTVMARVRAERAGNRFRFRVYPLAASLAALLALGSVVFLSMRGTGSGSAAIELVARQRVDGTFSASSASDYVQAFAVAALAQAAHAPKSALPAAVRALVRSQGADGGWRNARLSAYNVLALRVAAEAGVDGAHTAYRRGQRYLRAHDIPEPRRDDLVRAAKTAVARLGSAADPGLVQSAAFCAAL